jgi:GNAT superfamily N-acetyltransferase
VDGAVVCTGAIRMPQLDNLASAALAVDTEPALRRRGYGAAMLAHLEQVAVAAGRRLLDTETFYPGDAPADGAGHDNADFLTHRGYVFGLGDVHRRLELPVAPALLDQLAGEAAPHHAAYRIRTWHGRVPDELVESFTTINASLMTEAPAGEVEREPEVADVAVLREEEALREQQGRVPYVAVAVDRAGTVVAFTTVMTTVHEPGRGYQWGTVVDRAHRGHRLGIAVKVANLRALQQHDPPVRELFTYNAEVNAHMVAINDAVGFVPVERLGEFQKRL